MSRVTALLGKRNKASSGDSSKSKDDGNSSSVTTTPEKDKHNVHDVRRKRESSFAEHSTVTNSGGDRTSVIRRQPSNGSIVMHGTAADGTPIVYGSTTDENHSRSAKFGTDEGSANGKIRRGTFSRGGPALDIPRSPTLDSSSEQHTDENGQLHQYAQRLSSAYRPVGEGSLSLETLLGPNNQEILTPKAGHLPFQNATPTQRSHPELFVTDASPLPSPVPGSESAGYRRASASSTTQYPAVFESSDLGSSSSSSAVSRAEAKDNGQHGGLMPSEVPPILLHSSDDYRERSLSAGSMGSSLALPQGADISVPSTSRGRASTAISTGRPSVSPSPSRSSSFPLKANKSSKKAANGIAGALALSGVALASPAPGVAHPFHINRVPSASQVTRPTPVKKETGNSDALSSISSRVNGTSTLNDMESRSFPERRSTEEGDGFESPTPLSNYTPNDSPRYEDDPTFHAMVSIDALGEFDDLVTQMGTGYALASSKRNADFHSLFKSVPEDDYLIEDYGCALQREILIQGRLYISEHRLCFYANLFGWVTTLTLNFHEIIAIEKRNTALVIPNAILIATMHSRHTYASFISRDMTYDLIVSLWRNSHPVVPTSAALPDSAGIVEDDDEDFALSNAEEHTGNEAETGRKKRRMRKGRFRKNKGSNTVAGAGPDGDGAGANGRTLEVPGMSKGRSSLSNSTMGTSPASAPHAPTQCNCVTSGTGHFSNVVMDATFPGSPEKLYNLMFTSGFMKDFLTKDMKLTDLQIGDWAPQTNGSHLLTRTYSYIKAINAPVGPKSTKCILIDENLHVDFDDFVVNLTTTKTPEVPSGGSFSVKTKTCFTWAKNNATRVLVTTAVEWTGRSFIKSIVDKSSLDGQKTLYIALDTSIRSYISAHKSEFYAGGEAEEDEEVHQGVDDSLHERETSSGSAGGDGTAGSSTSQNEPLAFISNTVPFSRPFCDFATTLYDTIADVLGQMSRSTLICSFIIFVLFVSNMFTLSSLRHTSSRYVPQRRPPPDYAAGMHGVEADGQDVVAAAVRGVLQEYFQHASHGAAGPLSDAGPQRNAAPVENRATQETGDAREIWNMIESLEKRVEALKASLKEVD